MFLILVACSESSLHAPPPYVEPSVQQVWLTAMPDELHRVSMSEFGTRFVYEDVVDLPDDTLGATLIARTLLDGATCAPVDVWLGATSEGGATQSVWKWTGQAQYAVHHVLDPVYLHDPLQLFVATRSPLVEGCPPAPLLELDGIELVITRGARR